MANKTINQKPPGSFYDNNGRWAWKVKLPGDKGTRADTEHFTAQTYGRAITRAIKRINAARKAHKPPMQDLLQSWSPNQLRHAKATENRAKYGRNIAALLLGHAPGSGATDIYTRQAIKDEEREKAKQELREAVKGLPQE